MKEYIERAAVLNETQEIYHWAGYESRYDEFVSCEDIRNIPAADVVEVRHGRWAEYDGADKGFHYCSECKRQAFNYEENGEVIEVLSKWCPHCGALMDGKETAHD